MPFSPPPGVKGPASSGNANLAAFQGTSGEILQDTSISQTTISSFMLNNQTGYVAGHVPVFQSGGFAVTVNDPGYPVTSFVQTSGTLTVGNFAAFTDPSGFGNPLLVDSGVPASGAIGSAGHGLIVNSGTVFDQNQGTITLSGTTTGTITPGAHDSFLVNVGTAAGTVSVGPGFAGQRLRLDIKQGATPQAVAFDSTVIFGSTITSYTATNTANDVDEIQLILSQDTIHWRFAGLAQGFAE